MQRLRSWAGAHDSWLSRSLSSLLDPSRPEARALALPTVLLVVAAWLFFGVLEDVVNGDPLLLADSAIYRALQDLRTTPGDAVMIAITELGDTKVVMAVTIAVLLSCCLAVAHVETRLAYLDGVVEMAARISASTRTSRSCRTVCESSDEHGQTPHAS